MWFLFFPTCPNFFSPTCYHFPLYLKNKSFGWALICNNNNQNFNKCSSPSPEEQIQEGPQSSGLSLSQMFSFIIRKWPFVDMKRKDWTSTSQSWFPFLWCIIHSICCPFNCHLKQTTIHPVLSTCSLYPCVRNWLTQTKPRWALKQ